MKKLGAIKVLMIIFAAVGIICFWVFGFKGIDGAARISLVSAGICGWVSLALMLAEHIISRRYIV